jgi:hypothetical protein
MQQPAILQMLSGAQPQGLGQIKQIVSQLRSLSNPQAALQQMMQQRNPAMMQALDYIKTHGNDPKAAFQSLAQERGIDPAEIENMLK